LATYHAHFAPFFKRSEQRDWAEVYLRGLLTADVRRKNTEAMALRLLGAGPGAAARVRALQQFIGEGGWDDAAILAAHQRLVDRTLGEPDGVLIVDGSDVPKQGEHSVGVAHQWCGATGKLDNCQAGVFLGYASRQGYTLLDRRLFLPECWFTAAYRERWTACAIPKGVTFASKTVLAASMVEAVQAERRVQARWLVGDEGYGKDPSFLDRVDAAGLWYLAEVPCATAVWPLVEPADGTTARARPAAWLRPQQSSRKGPAPTKQHVHPDSPAKLRLEVVAAQLPAEQWQRYRLLEGSKGPLVADFAAFRAVAVRHRLPGPEVWVLLRRTIPSPGEQPVYKYYLSQAPAETPLAELVRVSGMRWPIEACFEEGKEEVGLDQYELRFWRGWHHHMTLVILAHHFLVRLQRRLDQRGGGPTATSRFDPAARIAPRRSSRLRGRGRSTGLSTPATPSPARAAQPAPSAPTPARRPPVAPLRPAGRPRPPGLPAAAQHRRLPFPPQAHPAPPDQPSSLMHVSLYY
jgi:SRSO17 transposase